MRARRRWVAALVISASLLVPLVVFGGTALANGFAALAQYGHGPGSAQYQYNGKAKVTICHATHSAKNPFVTIVVSPQGAANHLKHHPDDKAGACATTHSSAARDNQHGKKDQSQAKKQDHGQANSQSANQSKDDHGNGRDDDEDDDKGGGQGNGNNGSNGKGHNK